LLLSLETAANASNFRAESQRSCGQELGFPGCFTDVDARHRYADAVFADRFDYTRPWTWLMMKESAGVPLLLPALPRSGSVHDSPLW
jgi:hypothetical protein